jgi:hypothetical protein
MTRPAKSHAASTNGRISSASAPPAEWTVLLYMGAVDDGQARDDKALLESLGRAASSANVHFVYQLATAKHTLRGRVTARKHRDEHDHLETLARDPPIDITDPQYLTSFVDWAQEKYPARHTALILKDHGYGWEDPLPQKNAPEKKRLRMSAIFHNGLTGHWMNTADLREAIDKTRLGHVDVYGFDSCFMSAVEVAYEVREVASFMVASETEVVKTGWAYETILAELREHPSVGPRELARTLVQLGGDPFALAAVELSWMERLAEAIDGLGRRLGGDLPRIASFLVGKHGPAPLTVDLMDVPALLEWIARDHRLDKGVVDAAARVGRVLEDAVWSYKGDKADKSLSIFLPLQLGSSYLASYGGAAMARRDVCWSAFVSALNAQLLEMSAAKL